MAERRMFTKRVTDDDHFMELSASAQALYLHLNMSADDDGFCNQVSIAMFKAHASVADLEQLLKNRYIYQFQSGVIVIKHWRMANALRKDRYTSTAFKEELAQLGIKENGSYTMLSESSGDAVAKWLPDGCQVVADCLPQDRLGKDSLGKDSLDNKGKTKVFRPPTLEEVSSYCLERKNNVNPQHFIDHYSARGWMIGKNKMKDWKAAVRTWERNDFNDGKQSIHGNASSSTEESTSKWNLHHSN